MSKSPDDGLALTASTAGAPAAATHVRALRVVVDTQAAVHLQHLTQHSVVHLEDQLGHFASQVVREAQAIEKSEHVGHGPPEVTAAHIDEAWWVARRRIRRRRHPYWLIFARAAETLGSAGFGVGATMLQKPSGVAVFIGSVVALLAGFLIEAYVSARE
jgi:hypothetical protein